MTIRFKLFSEAYQEVLNAVFIQKRTGSRRAAPRDCRRAGPGGGPGGPEVRRALTFSPDGVLFVGDNVGGAVFAYPIGKGTAPTGSTPPLEVDNINARVAEALGVTANEITINGMAVHPVTQDVYLSVSRGFGQGLLPAVVRVSPDGAVSNVDLTALHATEYKITDAPGPDQHFRDRAKDWVVPGPVKYDAKAQIPMRTLTIVDMKYHNGELFVSGISNEEFASTLRRIPYPFTGRASESKVRIYHIAHTRYETRAPIRAMQFGLVDGQDTLIAAYTCSPLVLIPVAELKDGAKVTGKTIGDMGNGQPLSMFPVKMYGKDALFVTNAGHGPRMIPLDGLAKPSPTLPSTPQRLPVGPVARVPDGSGGQVRDVRRVVAARRPAQRQVPVSLTRDADSGSLNLEALPITPLPMKLDQIWSEFDFNGGGPEVTLKDTE